jgi:hypothetical protein
MPINIVWLQSPFVPAGSGWANGLAQLYLKMVGMVADMFVTTKKSRRNRDRKSAHPCGIKNPATFRMKAGGQRQNQL